MSNEKVGMKFEDVRSRVKRISGSQGGNVQMKANLCNSLINQARLRDGEGAAREIRREFFR